MLCPRCKKINENATSECVHCGAYLLKADEFDNNGGMKTAFGGENPQNARHSNQPEDNAFDSGSSMKTYSGGQVSQNFPPGAPHEVDVFDNNSDFKTTAGVEFRSDSLPIGTLFARRYETLQKGLKGGMGMVYKVKDTTLQKTVALKLVLPEYQNERAIDI